MEGDTRRWMNQSVPAVGRCLVAYEWYRRSVRDVDDGVGALAIVADKIRAADPEALRDNDRYWSLMIEQMNAGLL